MKIIEIIIENYNTINFVYNTNNERRKTIYKENTTTTLTKYFSTNYERQITTDNTRELHYIFAGDGLCAVYEKTSSETDNIYYTHKDYLGSITEITDKDGVLLQRINYDVWGKRTLEYNNSAFSDFILDRGYTGHEHLDLFGLINMNGRLYDPMLGMMLSPDNSVQSATYSQSFNRYSYCYNNPLKFTDPSGNVVHFLIPVAIGFVVGAYTGAAIQQEDAWIGNWDWSDKNMGKSALAWGIVGAGVGLGFSSAFAKDLGISGMSSAKAGFSDFGATTTLWNITSNALITGSVNVLSSGLQTGWDTDVMYKSGLVGVAAGAIGGYVASSKRFTSAANRRAMSVQGIRVQNYITNILSGAGDRLVKSLENDELGFGDHVQNTFWGGAEGAISARMFSSDKFLNLRINQNDIGKVTGRYFSGFLSNVLTSNPGASMMAARIYGSIYPTWMLGRMNSDIITSVTASLTFSPFIYIGESAFQSKIVGPNYPYAYNIFDPNYWK